MARLAHERQTHVFSNWLNLTQEAREVSYVGLLLLFHSLSYMNVWCPN